MDLVVTGKGRGTAVGIASGIGASANQAWSGSNDWWKQRKISTISVTIQKVGGHVGVSAAQAETKRDTYTLGIKLMLDYGNIRAGSSFAKRTWPATNIRIGGPTASTKWLTSSTGRCKGRQVRSHLLTGRPYRIKGRQET